MEDNPFEPPSEDVEDYDGVSQIPMILMGWAIAVLFSVFLFGGAGVLSLLAVVTHLYRLSHVPGSRFFPVNVKPLSRFELVIMLAIVVMLVRLIYQVEPIVIVD